MSKLYAQFDMVTGVIYSVVQSSSAPVGPNVVEVQVSDCLGKKWDGGKIVAAPVVPIYKVWSKPAFVLSIGRAAFDSIVDGGDKDLRFAKYVLDSAGSVDLNVPEYAAMVEMLKTKGVITAAKLAELKAQV